jgi:hypothetical protein
MPDSLLGNQRIGLVDVIQPRSRVASMQDLPKLGFKLILPLSKSEEKLLSSLQHSFSGLRKR